MGGAEHPVGVQPQLVTPDGKGLLVGAYQDSDDLRLVRIDRETGEETVVAAVEGHSLCILGMMAPGVLPPTVFTSQHTGEVIAARFVGDRPRIEVLDPHFAEVYAELEKLSDGVLGTLSSDESEQRWVATFIHDREPAVTWFYDHGTGESRLLSRPYPRLDPAALAPMTAVHFPARDGLPLHGFLTLPVGIEPRGLPLVLLVHGGPWAHDTWGYSPQAQFLANRGHAVLQVNFRGSTGSGKRHTTSAIGEFARDARRSHRRRRLGGGAGLRRPGPHRHLRRLLRRLRSARRRHGRPRLLRRRGRLRGHLRPRELHAHPAAVHQALQRQQLVPLRRRPRGPRPGGRHAGPLTHHQGRRIRTPLLVAQGANDVRVVQAESDNIVESLRDRGVPVEYIVAEDEGHGFANPENQFRLHRAIERHFAEHLGEHLGDRRDTSAPA